MSIYEFWDKENGFYGYDEFALKPKPATKKVQKILQAFIDKGYKYSLECNDGKVLIVSLSKPGGGN